MDRRRVLFLLGLGGPALWLTGGGLIRLSSDFVVELAGRCSFCHTTHYRMAAVPGLPYRICEPCTDLCLLILSEHGVPAPPAAVPELSPDAALQAELERSAQEERELEALIRRQVMGSPPPRLPQRSALHCSFCERGAREVDKLIAGPNVYICDGCIGGASALIGHLRTHLA